MPILKFKSCMDFLAFDWWSQNCWYFNEFSVVVSNMRQILTFWKSDEFALLTTQVDSHIFHNPGFKEFYRSGAFSVALTMWEEKIYLGMLSRPRYANLTKVFCILVSFRLSFIWLESVFILSLYLNTKLKTKNNRLKQTSIQNALKIASAASTPF